MAQRVGLNQTAISRIWRTFGLKPHRIEDFKLSTDPQFIDKVRDVVGLYLNPPDAAVVLCVDEKTEVQALDRTAPILPMLPGVPTRRSHDYVRNGTSDLYAALDVVSGKVLTQMTDQHRAVEFRKFLNLINRSVPDELAVHVICDNASTRRPPRSCVGSPVTVASRSTTPRPTAPGSTKSSAGSPSSPPRNSAAPPTTPSPTCSGHQQLGRTLEPEPTTVHLAQDRRRDPRQPRQLSPKNQRLTTLGRCGSCCCARRSTG